MVWFWKSQPKPAQADLAAPPSSPSTPHMQPQLATASPSASQPAAAAPVTLPLSTNHDPPYIRRSGSERAARQLGLFFGGWVFFALSLRVARRAVARRYKAIYPPYFYSNTKPVDAPVGALEALEALYVSTLNVGSFGMVMTGGAMWAFDIDGLEDLRRRLRGRLYRDDSIGDAGPAPAEEQPTPDWVHNAILKEEADRLQREQLLPKEQPLPNEQPVMRPARPVGPVPSR